jgi:hypothetical protein
MLRSIVVVLLLANLGFWAWSTGLLAVLGWAPATERDPTRLERQVRPDAVRVLLPSVVTTPAATAAGGGSVSARAARLAPDPANAASRNNGACLEAGPFAGSALESAERALAAAALPDDSWIRTSLEVGAQYAVVLGPFVDRDALQKKREEIGRLQLPFEALELSGEGGVAQPGFALGRYDTRGAAEAALTTFNQRGVRTARVSLLRPARSETRLRVENATPAQVEKLRALSGGALGAGFAACESVAAGAPAAPSR